MTKRKSHLPENYFLTEDEKQDLRDWALEAFARMEARSGKVVPLVRNAGTGKTAQDAWEERKRQREQDLAQPVSDSEEASLWDELMRLLRKAD